MTITRTDRSRPWIPNSHGQRSQKQQQQQQRRSESRERRKGSRSHRQTPHPPARKGWLAGMAGRHPFPNPLEMARVNDDKQLLVGTRLENGGYTHGEKRLVEARQTDRQAWRDSTCDAHQIAKSPFLVSLAFWKGVFLYLSPRAISPLSSLVLGGIDKAFAPGLWLGDAMWCDDACLPAGAL